MQGLPANGHPETVYLYAVILIIFGCLKSWVSPVCPSRTLLLCMQTLYQPAQRLYCSRPYALLAVS